MKQKRILALSLIIIFAFAGVSVAFAAEPTQFKIGDADLNSVVNVRDATLIQKHVASMVQLSDEALKVADTDASGKVNVKDATLIQKYVAGLVDSFPGENASEPATTLPTEAPTKPSVDDDGYFDVVVRP